jgi:hypothetical protein
MALPPLFAEVNIAISTKSCSVLVPVESAVGALEGYDGRDAKATAKALESTYPAALIALNLKL